MTFGSNMMMDSGGGLPISFIQGGTYDTGDSYFSSFNFTGVNFGTPDANRVIVCCLSYSTSPYSSATIGGVPATLIQTNGTNGSFGTLIYAVVPTGTTGTVSVIWAGGNVNAKLAPYSIYNLKNTTPVSSSTIYGSGAISGVISNKDSIVIAMNATQYNISHVWSGTLGVAQDTNFSTSANYHMSTAHLLNLTSNISGNVNSSSMGVTVKNVAVWE